MKPSDFLLHTDKFVSHKKNNFQEQRKKVLTEENSILLKKIEKKIIQILKKEGGAAGLDPIKKAVDKMDQPKGFNLKSTLQKMKNVEKHKNSDYILTPINEEKEIYRETIKKIIAECWKGYVKKGMKKKGDKMVPNCVPTNEDSALTLSKKNMSSYAAKNEDIDEDLNQWFKDDWVRIDTQGNIKGKCGKKKKSKKTQRCLHRKKEKSLSKKQRAATSRKKTKSNKQYESNTKAAGGRKKKKK